MKMQKKKGNIPVTAQNIPERFRVCVIGDVRRVSFLISRLEIGVLQALHVFQNSQLVEQKSDWKHYLVVPMAEPAALR